MGVRWLPILLAAFLVACGGESSTSRDSSAAEAIVERPAELSGRGSHVTAEEPPPPDPHPPPPYPPELEHQPSGRIVRVLDEHGRPVVGAVVHPLWSSRHRARTDENGEADPGPLGGGHGTPTQFRESWTVVVRVPGYAAHLHQVENRPDAYETVILRERGHVLAGRCLDSRGDPVPDVELRIVAGIHTVKLRTDAEGRFRTDEASPTEGRLEVTSSEWISRRQRVVPPTEDLVVTVHRPATIEVLLTFDHEDAPSTHGYPGVTLEPEAYRSHFWTNRSLFTADVFPGRMVGLDGEDVLFTVDLQEGETVRLGPMKAPPKRVKRRATPTTPFLAKPRTRPLRFDLHGVDIPEIRVTAFFADGRALHLGYIHPDKNPEEVEDEVRVPEGELRALGFTRTTWGRRMDGVSVGWMQPAPPGDVGRIEPPPPVRVIGRRPVRGVPPAEGGSMGLRFAGSTSWAASFLRDDDAPTRSCTVGPGRYDVVWHRGTYRGSVLVLRDVEVPAGVSSIELPDLVVPKPVTLEVRVVDPRGRPIPGAVVRWGHDLDRRKTVLRTGDDGIARFPLTDPTQLVIRAEADGYVPAERRLSTFDEGGRIVLRLGEE